VVAEGPRLGSWMRVDCRMGALHGYAEADGRGGQGLVERRGTGYGTFRQRALGSCQAPDLAACPRFPHTYPGNAMASDSIIIECGTQVGNAAHACSNKRALRETQ